jgi:hypothetical protein
VTVKAFKKCCISNAVDETDVMKWNGSEKKRMGMLGVGVRKMKVLTVTLIHTGL